MVPSRGPAPVLYVSALKPNPGDMSSPPPETPEPVSFNISVYRNFCRVVHAEPRDVFQLLLRQERLALSNHQPQCIDVLLFLELGANRVRHALYVIYQSQFCPPSSVRDLCRTQQPMSLCCEGYQT